MIRDDEVIIVWNGWRKAQRTFKLCLKYRTPGSSKCDYRLMKKRGYDMKLLRDVVDLLRAGTALDQKYKDHPLDGDYIGSRECHIRPDWLLIYQKNETQIILRRTGSHSELL